MFATLFILFNTIVTASDARRVSHFMSSPHILPDTAVFDDTIQCMSSTTYYVLSLLSIVPISFFISFFISFYCFVLLELGNILAILVFLVVLQNSICCIADAIEAGWHRRVGIHEPA